MEILEYLEKANNVLEVSFIFRGFKFVLGFYLILMAITISLMVWRMVKIGYLTLLRTGQEFPVVKGKMQQRWEEVQEWLRSNDPAQWNAAVLESATILNEILGTIGYAGQNLGEKLDVLLPNQMDNLEQAKEANKVKNKIVNDPDFRLKQQEAEQIVEVFAESLRYFEAIS